MVCVAVAKTRYFCDVLECLREGPPRRAGSVSKRARQVSQRRSQMKRSRSCQCGKRRHRIGRRPNLQMLRHSLAPRRSPAAPRNYASAFRRLWYSVSRLTPYSRASDALVSPPLTRSRISTTWASVRAFLRPV